MAASRALRGEQGAAAVEFALVLPLLMLLIFGIVDFGRMLNAQIVLTEAAREGARATSIVDQSEGEAKVDAVLDGLGPVSKSVNGCPTPPGPGDDAVVTLTHTFSFVTPIGFLTGIAGGPITLKGTGVMPCLR